MKFQLLLIALMGIQIYSQSKPLGTCSANPFFQQLQQFVQLLNNQNLNITKQMNTYLNGSPQIQPGLQTCTQFSNSSCCTTDFEAALANITRLYFTTREQQSFPFTTIIQQLQTSIQNCGVRDPKSFVLIEQAPIAGLSSAIKQYRQNIAQLLTQNSQFIRGNLCILCATPSEYANLILSQTSTTTGYQLQLIIDSKSYTQYLTDMTITFQKLQAQIPIFKTLFVQYFTQYADTTKCASILTKLSSYMDNLQFCEGGDCLSYLKQRVNIFKQEMDEELIYVQQPDFGFATTQQTTTNSRLLSQQDSFILQSTNGLITYISVNAVDSTIKYQGSTVAQPAAVFGQMIVGLCVILFLQI